MDELCRLRRSEGYGTCADVGMLRQGIHVGLQPLNVALVLPDLLREILHQAVLQLILLALMGRFHDFQPGHVHIQLHALLDAGVPGTQGLDLGIGQRRLVHILAGTHRGFRGHDLRNEFLLVLHCLPQVGVKGPLGDITVHMDFLIFVAPALNAALALGQVAGPPGTVQVMEGKQQIL